MKYMQIIAHTKGGEVRSAPEQVTERDYETVKEGLNDIPNKDAFTFNTEEGWVLIPTSQIFYVEITLS